MPKYLKIVLIVKNYCLKRSHHGNNNKKKWEVNNENTMPKIIGNLNFEFITNQKLKINSTPRT